MQREIKTADEIRREVSRRIHEGKQVQEDGVTITVPLPARCVDGIREPNGSNWTMAFFGNARGYEGWVLHVLAKVQSMWDLKG